MRKEEYYRVCNIAEYQPTRKTKYPNETIPQYLTRVQQIKLASLSEDKVVDKWVQFENLLLKLETQMERALKK